MRGLLEATATSHETEGSSHVGPQGSSMGGRAELSLRVVTLRKRARHGKRCGCCHKDEGQHVFIGQVTNEFGFRFFQADSRIALLQ